MKNARPSLRSISLTPSRSPAGEISGLEYGRAAALAVLVAWCGFAAAGGAAGSDGTSQREAGRLIYESGILPDGSPLRAERPEGFVLEGADAACVTCHRPSGMGSVEGSIGNAILVPPVAGPVLFAPARFHGVYLDPVHHWVPNAPWRRALTRSAYDEPRLARALREGVDPDGVALLAPMPRYSLGDSALAALAAYLRELSARPSPGVENGILHLATVIAPDVPAAQSDAVLGVVQAWAGASRASGHEWRLHVWALSGAPEGWEAQLAEWYAKQPVFAVLSGVGRAEWRPVHRFCERQRVACVLPSVEVAPEGSDGFYAVYFSPGVTLEARLLARDLKTAGLEQRTSPGIVQVYADASGQRAARTLGAELVTEDRHLRITAPATALTGLGADDTLVLWLRPAELEQLVASVPARPAAGCVYLSALLAPPGSVRLPASWKAKVVYVSLFDDLGVQSEIARLRLRRWLRRAGVPAAERDLRLQGDAYAACYLFAKALDDIREQEIRRPPVPLRREHLLEMLETEVQKYSDGTRLVDPDSHVAFYGRMSLGPGQRFAVHGGTLLRYAAPDADRLQPIGERIVP